MRFAAVDMGSNSTRLLIADLDADGHLTEIARRSTVTRLGHAVDATGRLDPAAIERFDAELAVIRGLLDKHQVERAVGVMTSAVRDASDGPELMTRVREQYAIEALLIPGQQEAALTYLGATSGRGQAPHPVAVVDVGGGSTEFVIGHDSTFDFSVSVQAGVVRQSERHIHHDPPTTDEIRAMADESAGIFREAVPDDARRDVGSVIAVAGTATSCASMLLRLDEYDMERVHGFRLQLAEIEALLARLALMDDAERQAVRGLQPDRSPTIVAGCVLLAEALRTFGVKECEVSEHDILRGVIIAAAQGTL
jgi:exopolyphosphatase/guanosine-5'-triphosphate,3'-diphosphate pyrophosphatase